MMRSMQARRAVRPTSRTPRTALAVLGGAALAVAASGMFTPAASADGKGGQLRLVDVNVGGFDGVYQNSIIELTFTAPVNPSSVNPAVFQVRERNATGTGFTKQIPGTFQTVGSLVRFYPRLPTHLRDPASPTGDFFGAGTPNDDADENAALQPDTDYQIRIVGAPSVEAVRSTRGRKLTKTTTAKFRTSGATPKTQSFTIDTYGDSPPPAFSFSNPSDKVASAEDQYARHGGTREVPNAIAVTLFGNRVPVSPSTLRAGSNCTLQLTERFGDPKFARPIPGSAFVEQNFDSTRIVFNPRFALPDRGVYALEVRKDVKDLTETYDFESNAERLRLREIYEYLLAAQALQPGASPEELPDPPSDLIYDWPTDPYARGVLKGNLLVLGSTYPEEVDPRVMVLFSTRDEPITNGALSLEFVQSDNLYDSDNSTASYDELVPGATSAILTISGGSGQDGDFEPGVSQTINLDSYPNWTVNWRKVRIPPNVVVTVTGSRPGTIKALDLQLDGIIRADGGAGQDASTGSYVTLPTKPPFQKGGVGGPGGGKGGDSNNDWVNTNNYNTPSNGLGRTGSPGVDSAGGPAAAGDGGQGGLGGTMGTGTYYNFGAAGGGGGARTAGTAGATGGYTFYPSWNGKGGNGGAGSSNDDLDPFVGGAGGGAGGNSLFAYSSYLWAKNAGAGGGGGGALLIQTSAVFKIGTSGKVEARGGRGGNGTGSSSTLNAGPGGGGGGGSVLLRSSKGFDIASIGTFYDVRGGAGGTHTGSYVSSPGGTGGTGYVRLEDPNGGVQVSGGSTGTYDPVGGGVASYTTTKWVDLGVDQPRVVNFSESDFLLSAAGNDAVYIEVQMAVEDPNQFGEPLLSALNPDQTSSDTSIVSDWTPVRIRDLSGIPGGAFGAIPGYNPSIHGTDYIFPVADKLNDKNYKFFRVRVFFQLDGSQSSRDPFPYLDRLTFNFQFNI